MLKFTLPTDKSFRFRPTIESHGWFRLPPFAYDIQTGVLERVQRISSGGITRIQISESDHGLTVIAEGDATEHDVAEIESVVGRVLCMDWDMADFYAALRDLPVYAWVEANGAGRLLRSPTVWEDLTKTLMTTNTTWRQTIGMCERLCALGDDSPFGHVYPTPEQIAAHSSDALTESIRCGYRGAYLHELATRIASGDLDIESWIDPELDSGDLYKRMIAVKGFGDYAVGSMMRLLGHHDRLSIDSVCRDMYKTRHNDGEKSDDKAIRAHYEPHGRWRGMLMWMDVIAEDYE
jgi:N-glycosylase/DNA lyase